MQLIQKIEDLQSILSKSPILSWNKSIPIDAEVVLQLNSYRRETEILLEKCSNPLKIVIMGEVKAGKSTLLNAFAGEAVSPTNVTETTACIIDIKHSTERRGSLLKKSGETVNSTIEELYETLDENRGNQAFFSNVSVVKLEFPLQSLKKIHLVDTPGLETVTMTNEQTAIDYIQNSDVVLWVFSAHHLGQLDIEEQIANVKSYGKPIVAVINRLDQVDGTAEQLESYIQEQLGFFVEESFAISAYQAYEGISTKNTELLAQSRYPLLLSYLEENIEKEDKQIQDKSLKDSIEAIVDKEKNQHQILRDDIANQLEFMKKPKEELAYHNDTIMKKMKMELNNWVATHLLEDEKRELMNDVEGLGMIAGKTSYDAISARLNEIVSSDYLIGILEKKFAEVDELFRQEWNEAIQLIGENIVIEEQELNMSQQRLYESRDAIVAGYIPQGESAVKDGAIKGAALGGAYGVAAATYAAVLGPSAAAISLGAALSAFMPPVLLLGAAGGIAINLVSGNKKKKEYTRDILKVIDETKQKVVDIFLPAMLNHIETENNKIAKNLYDQLCSLMAQGWTEAELIDLQHSLSAYHTNLVRWEHGNRAVSIV